MMNRVYYGDALNALTKLEDKSVDLAYIRLPIRVSINRNYQKKIDLIEFLSIGSRSYDGSYKQYLLGIAPFLIEIKKKIKKTGVFYLHGEYQKTHYIKALLLDKIFSRKLFLNEIIWVKEQKIRQGGGWPQKHENILVYSNSAKHKFYSDSIDRIEYMAPSLVSKEKRETKKLPTDTWWFTQINAETMLNRLVVSTTDKNDVVLALFPENELFGKVCLNKQRQFILIEKSKKRAKILWNKFGTMQDIEWIGDNLSEVYNKG